MTARNKPFFELTAGDLMSGPVESIREDMTLHAAAEFLRRSQVSGAPVVDGAGRCVGVLSMADLVRWAEELHSSAPPTVGEIATCSFLDGERCTLPLGACPVQRADRDGQGKEIAVCRMPHCVLADWQVVLDALPAKQARHFMTADPVLIEPSRPLVEVARMMTDAHIHRVIVVDEERRPIGVVSGTDVIAAVARYGAQRAAEPKRAILYPTDLSEASESAFPVACDLAKKENARLIVLHVYPPPMCHGEVVARRQADSYESDLMRLLGKYRSPDPGVQVEHRLVEGDTTPGILRVAEEEGCALIVMGTKGRTGLARMLLGSVAEEVLRHAPCPVLTIRPGASVAAGKEAGKEVAEQELASV
jgi:nucleotide-binding universal stress UspA family protein